MPNRLGFLCGDHLGDLGNCVLVLALVALAGAGALGGGHPATTDAPARAASAARYGIRLFLPALIVPAAALAGTLLLPYAIVAGYPLVDPKQVTLVSLGIGVVLALGVAMAWLRPPLLAPLQEGRALIDAVGWGAVLPQMLAALGAVFTLAGVGTLIGAHVAAWLPDGSRIAAVCAYSGGMALLTIALGNAMAAFPVMASAVGLPILVCAMGADAAVVCALGMLSGFCGTLLTPMAANFNIVPVRLLGLSSPHALIRAQAGTALPLLALNTLFLLWFAW